MDAAKKAKVEKLAVLMLAGVFVAVFIMGPMRSMGLFPSGGAGAAASASIAGVPVTKSVGGLLQQGWDKMGQQLDSVSTPGIAASAPAPAYTAFNRRDPFKSYLPRPVAPVDAQSATPTVENTPPLPPPQLRVDGLLWGGPEPKAIINGRLYRVDDRVDGVKIVAIGRDGVTVEHLGKSIVYSTAAR